MDRSDRQRMDAHWGHEAHRSAGLQTGKLADLGVGVTGFMGRGHFQALDVSWGHDRSRSAGLQTGPGGATWKSALLGSWVGIMNIGKWLTRRLSARLRGVGSAVRRLSCPAPCVGWGLAVSSAGDRISGWCSTTGPGGSWSIQWPTNVGWVLHRGKTRAV